jgi:phosphate transport system substrate-binding protein
MTGIRTKLFLKAWGIIAACATLLISLPSFAGGGFLQIKGSDTEVNLVQRLAEVYMEKHPSAFIAVTGGGSGTGIAALINGKLDIADSSREIKAREIEQARARGVEPVGFVIAMDGLSIIVPSSNPVKSLTVEQVGRIFRGEITNWNQLGGPDMPISIYGRQSNSGTFVYFRDHILKGNYSSRMKRMNGNAQIVEAVRRDRAGIGYVGVGYVKDEATGQAVKGIKPLIISREKGAPGASPLDAAAVESGEYPVARPLNQYTNGKPTGAVREFISWEISEEGQKVAVEMGFFPITPKYREQNRRNMGEFKEAR